MKNTFLLLALFSILAACTNPNAQSQDQTQDESADNKQESPSAPEGYKSFGEVITLDGAVDPSKLMAMMEGKDKLNVKFVSDVKAVCKKKGCWMDVNIGNDETMKVRFKDYGFFVPKDCEGQTAVMEGELITDTISVDMQKHYAEDGGEAQEVIDAITEPKVAYAFTATGVLLKDK